MFILIACVLVSCWVEAATYRCPSTTPLFFPDPWNTKCISAQDCRSVSFVVYGRTCVHYCPPRTLYQEESSTCYNKCPIDTIRIGSRCLNGTYCMSNNNQVLFNGTCVPFCPSSLPFTKDGSCLKECPADTVRNNTDKSVTVNGTTCLSKKECTDGLGHFIYNNTCVPKCPPAANFSDQGSCTSFCPKETCLLGTDCILVTECVTRNRVIFRNECMAVCPAEAPYDIDNICYSTCPKNYVLNDETCIGIQQCISTYRLFKVIFNNTCVDTCPLAAPLNHQGICEQSCPGDTVVSDMQCVDSSMCVENSMFIYNGTCVSECPGRSPYVANGYCYPTCPQAFVATSPGQFQCISESICIYMKKMVYNRTCTTACPRESPYTRSRHCYQTCPQKTASLPDKKCVSYQKCKMQGNVVHESKCLRECPSAFPYRLHDTCILECPLNTSIFPGKKCVSPSDCSTIKDAIMFNGTCLPKCPSFAPYVHSGTCLSKCPTGFFAKGSDCLANDKCQNVLYNGTCLSSCPQEAPNRKDSYCYSICPSGTYIYQAKCINQYECQEKEFYLSNGSCVSTCPPGSAGYTDYACHPLIFEYGAIIVTPFLLLMALMCLIVMMYNPKESRLMNAPAKLQVEGLARGEFYMAECVTLDNRPGQQQDNVEHPYEGNMGFISDDEILPLVDHRNNPQDVDIFHGVANYSNNVIVHPQGDDDNNNDDDVPLCHQKTTV